MLGCGQTPSSQLHYKREAEAKTWTKHHRRDLGTRPKPLKLIVASLLLEELLVSGIRFIFFSNWGDYLYRARVSTGVLSKPWEISV